jgi:hypothetical protein
LTRIGHALTHLGAWRFAVHQAIGDIVEHAQVGKQRVALEHDAVVAPSRWQARDIASGLKNLARSLHLQARNDAQQGGFATARRPQKTDKLAFLNGEIDVLQGGKAAKLLADMAQIKKWHGMYQGRPAHCSGQPSERPPQTGYQ